MRFIKGQIPWNKKEWIKKECQICSKEFFVSPARKEKARFCGYKCYWNWRTTIKLSEEHKKRIGKAQLGHGRYLKFHSKETKEKMSRDRKGKQYIRDAGLKGVQSMYRGKPTAIEVKVYEALKNMGFIFERQKIINGKFVVDAYIPSLNLVIEADGDYWHSLDRIVKKDRAENAYLTKCGFNVLRLSESEIENGKFVENFTTFKRGGV